MRRRLQAIVLMTAGQVMGVAMTGVNQNILYRVAGRSLVTVSDQDFILRQVVHELSHFRMRHVDRSGDMTFGVLLRAAGIDDQHVICVLAQFVTCDHAAAAIDRIVQDHARIDHRILGRRERRRIG